MKWMIGTPLPAAGLKPHERIICTEEVESTVIAIVDKSYAGLVAASPELLEALKELTIAILAIRVRLAEPRDERERKAVDELRRLFTKASAAIKKAEERQ
jgi:hypothetical protein